jgi:hypothetical protein
MTPEQAFRAIKARINGVFDDPDLMSIGALSSNPIEDLHYILEQVPGEAPELETPRMLVLSTAHITYKTSQALANGLGCIPAGVARREYGWIIPIYKQWAEHEEGDDPVPADLIAIRDFAVANGCTWICLDQDGDILDALPSYDW